MNISKTQNFRIWVVAFCVFIFNFGFHLHAIEPEESPDAVVKQDSQTATNLQNLAQSKPQLDPVYRPFGDDFNAIIANSNASLNSAISFAKMGEYGKALELFTQACQSGNAAGCFGSGLIYMHGMNNGVPNPKEAVRYYAQACAGGDAVACANLALAYDNGQGVQENKEQALDLYAVACGGGDGLACNNLGWMYANGIGTQKDYAKSMDAYRAACGLGNELGCYNLGLMTNTNNIFGMTKDKMGIVEMNYVACEQGDNKACGNLGYLYATGTQGATQSYYYAAKYFTRACETGQFDSCNNLGVLYDSGLGVRQDKNKAIELFGLACDYGVQGACNNYTLMMKQGGVNAERGFFGM